MKIKRRRIKVKPRDKRPLDMDERKELVKKLITKKWKVERQAQEFIKKTGMSRRTFFRTKNVVKNEGQIITITNLVSSAHLIRKKRRIRIKQEYSKVTIVGLLITMIGIGLLAYYTPLSLKLGLTYIIIGFFVTFILPERRLHTIVQGATVKKYLDVSEIITLFMTLWILVMFFITNNADLETFFILIFVGMIMVQEITDELTPLRLKRRMYAFIFVFLMIFITVVSNRIISFLIG